MNERWQLVVTCVMIVLICPALAFGFQVHWSGLAVCAVIAFLVFLFLDSWNVLRINKNPMIDWAKERSEFLPHLLIFGLVPSLLNEIFWASEQIYLLILWSVLMVPLVKQFRKSYLQAGELPPLPTDKATSALDD